MIDRPVFSVFIFAHQEQVHIVRAIESALCVSPLVYVILSDKNDTTAELACRAGASIFYIDAPNFATKVNRALDTIDVLTTHVLRLDADEVFSQNFIHNLGLIETGAVTHDAVFFRRRLSFLGKPLFFGGCSKFTLRAWRKGVVCYENRDVDEEPILSGQHVKYLDFDIIDLPLSGVKHWLDKHIIYAEREAKLFNSNYVSEIEPRLFGSGIERVRFLKMYYYKMPFLIRPFIFFVYRYFLRFGFLDGLRGFYFHLLHSFWYRLLVELFLFEDRLNR